MRPLKPQNDAPSRWNRFIDQVDRLADWLGRQTPAPHKVQIDPLRNRVAAIMIALLVFVTAVVSLVLSIASGAPKALPAVALSSSAIFHLQRALVPTFAVALLSVFLVRAAFGYFPQKVSTTSAEWPAAAAAVAGAESASTDARLARLIEALTSEHDDLLDRGVVIDALAAAFLRLPNGRAILEEELRRLQNESSTG